MKLKLILIIMFLVFIGCGDDAGQRVQPEIFEVYPLEVLAAPVDTWQGAKEIQWWYDTIPDSPNLRAIVGSPEKTYYITGSEEEFYAWWHEEHPYWPFEFGECQALYLYMGTAAGNIYQIWIPGKRYPKTGGVAINPIVFYHEEMHHLNRISNGLIVDPHDW